MSLRVCPLCSAPLVSLRWRLSKLVSGFDYRCHCGGYNSEVVKDGENLMVIVTTTMRMEDTTSFLEGHVPGPRELQ